MVEYLPRTQEALGLIINTPNLGLADSKAHIPFLRFMNLNQPVFSFMTNMLLIETHFLFQLVFQEVKKKKN